LLLGEIPSQIEFFPVCCTGVGKIFRQVDKSVAAGDLLAKGALNFSAGRFRSPSPSPKAKDCVATATT
jgi:hypothetical protein